MVNSLMRDVVVQRLIRSPFARKYYRLSPQLRPIASVDLDGIESMEQLRSYWREIVKLTGNFSLLARDKKGMFVKSIAIMRVSRDWQISFKDERCPLAVRFRQNSEIQENDLEI